MKTFKCKYCEKVFEKKQSLGGHIIRCKSNPDPKGNCGFVKYNEEIREQKRNRPAHKRVDVVCKVCGKTYSQKGIGSHMWRSHGEGKGFSPFQQSPFVPWNKGKKKSDDERIAKAAETLSRNTKGRTSNQVWTDEMREKQSNLKKELYEIHPEKHPNRKLASNKKKWTYPEVIAANWFDATGIEYVKNMKVNRFFPDFVVGNLIIEIDGEYWHDKESDEKRDVILTKEGYTVHRIKAKEKIVERLTEIFK